MKTMKELTMHDLNLPAFMPLEGTFGLEPFTGTSKGSQMLASIAQREKIAKVINYGTIILAVGMMILSLVGANKAKVFTAIVLGGLIYGIGMLAKYLFTSFTIATIKNSYVKKRSEYAHQMAQTMVKNFGGYFYAFGNGYFFLYNQDLCLYVDAENGEWVGYDKKSIKSIELSHVHIGSSTVSKTSTSGVGIAWTSNVGTYHGSSTTHSESTSHYEWRFDIFSGFFHYPNLTMVFPDNGEGEDFAKKAKALLS